MVEVDPMSILVFATPVVLSVVGSVIITWLRSVGKVRDGTITGTLKIDFIQTNIAELETKINKIVDKLQEVDRLLYNYGWRLDEIQGRKYSKNGDTKGAV